MIIRRVLVIMLCSLSILSSSAACLGQGGGLAEKKVRFSSGGVEFSGTLFVPPGNGSFPAVIVLHGGSSNVKAHRATSGYYGRRFASRGIAALIFDKRGTGDSGGELAKTTFDDYVADAISAAEYLKKQEKIDPERIGVLGPSQGGRIAALAAARSSDIAFIVTFAAPLVSIADLCHHSSMDFLKRVEITDADKEIVDPLWKRHYRSVEAGDLQDLGELDLEIDRAYASVDTIFLPLKSDKLKDLASVGMGDFQPMYNSMGNDYISELSKVKVPWISIYAEFDEAVPVEQSIEIMKKQLAVAGNSDFEIKIIPDASHGFRNVKTNEFIRVEGIAIDWILDLYK